MSVRSSLEILMDVRAIRRRIKTAEVHAQARHAALVQRQDAFEDHMNTQFRELHNELACREFESIEEIRVPDEGTIKSIEGKVRGPLYQLLRTKFINGADQQKMINNFATKAARRGVHLSQCNRHWLAKRAHGRALHDYLKELAAQSSSTPSSSSAPRSSLSAPSSSSSSSPVAPSSSAPPTTSAPSSVPSAPSFEPSASRPLSLPESDDDLTITGYRDAPNFGIKRSSKRQRK
ncbi:unnamed protein product [Absidia cylindrospora]